MNFRTSIPLILLAANANAGPPHLASSEVLSDLIKASLTEKIADAEIRTPSLEKLCSQAPLSGFETYSRVRLVEDRPNGTALFEVYGRTADGVEKSELVQTPYSAWKKVVVAAKRIYPNTRLKDTDLRIQEMNVATGPVREYRGTLVAADSDLSKLQTRQTLLENQFVTTSAIERQPDLRKGDSVRLDLLSGDLLLSTQAIASENGSIGDRVRVFTPKTKKEVVGIVREDHSVEVRL